MKRLVGILALLMLAAWVVPAFAGDLEYGGFWRTRAFSNTGFTGDSDNENRDYNAVDMRGRMWVKYIINDQLSWTNRVEINVTWGDEDMGGGIGTDGTDYLRWKHSYVDYNTDIMDDLNLQFRIGLQGYKVARGFLFNDDFAGLMVTYDNEEGMKLPFVWMKVFEGGTLSGDDDETLDDNDVDFFGFAPEFSFLDDELTIKPLVFYLTSDDAEEWDATTWNTDLDVWYAGLEVNYVTDMVNLWALGIYETGTADYALDDYEFDVEAYLLAAGLELTFGDFGVHGQAIYASGDDSYADTDAKSFYVPQGQDYRWSEIMGEGMFDADGASNGAPGCAVTNLIAYNFGLSYQVLDNLKLTGDVWYAELAETNEYQPESELGTEVDLKVNWMLNDDLELTLVGAHLFAGDATTYGAEDPVDSVDEIGLQLSFKFAED